MLICKFATARSRPERIQGWVRYLEEVTGRAELDAETRRTLEQLLGEARVWVGAKTCP